MISSEFPEVTLITNANNVGFAKANNQGIRASLGEYVLLLNPDTIVPQGVLDVSVAAIRGMPEVGVLGCRLVYADGSPQLEAGRRLPSIWDYALQSLYLHAFFPKSPIFNRVLMPDWDHADCREVECLMGAFMLFRREELISIGMLDEAVFMYHEDVEICHRIRQSGRKVWFLGTQTVVHLSGRSSAKADRPLWLLDGEIRCQLMRSLYGPRTALTCRWIIGMRSVLRFSVGLIAWIPARVFGFAGREPDVFEISRSLRMLQWSIHPPSVFRYFPEMPNQWE
jgi:GT2 family glycosyltransferase